MVLFAESGHLSSCCSAVIDMKEYQAKHYSPSQESDASVLFGKVRCRVLKGFKEVLEKRSSLVGAALKKIVRVASLVHSRLKINSVSWSSYCATVYSRLLPSFDLFLKRGCKYKE